MQHLQHTTCMIHLVAKYQQPLERYAHRLIQLKHRAPDIVQWVMEETYGEQQFFEGPHLRPLLIEKTKRMCSGFNKAIAIAKNYKHPLNDPSRSSNSSLNT